MSEATIFLSLAVGVPVLYFWLCCPYLKADLKEKIRRKFVGARKQVEPNSEDGEAMFKGKKAFDEIHKRQRCTFGMFGDVYYSGEPGILERLEKLEKLEAKLSKLQGILNEVVDKVYEEPNSAEKEGS